MGTSAHTYAYDPIGDQQSAKPQAQPPGDDEAVVSSRRELALWRAEALLGGGLLAASAAACAIAMTFPNENVPARWALALPVALGACAAPCFCRVPWSSVVAVGLVALALAGL